MYIQFSKKINYNINLMVGNSYNSMLLIDSRANDINSIIKNIKKSMTKYMIIDYELDSLEIIKENPIIGVGTGDVNDQFLNKYDELKSPLTEERRLRAHNTYLTETVSFGLFGLLFFITWMLYFLYQQVKFKQVFGVVFIIV